MCSYFLLLLLVSDFSNQALRSLDVPGPPGADSCLQCTGLEGGGLFHSLLVPGPSEGRGSAGLGGPQGPAAQTVPLGGGGAGPRLTSPQAENSSEVSGLILKIQDTSSLNVTTFSH